MRKSERDRTGNAVVRIDGARRELRAYEAAANANVANIGERAYRRGRVEIPRLTREFSVINNL